MKKSINELRRLVIEKKGAKLLSIAGIITCILLAFEIGFTEGIVMLALTLCIWAGISISGGKKI